MRSNWLALLVLLALIAWGVYDYSQSTGNSQADRSQADSGSAVNIGIRKGEQAPDFQLYDLAGNPVKRSDYLGKKVLLNFWATWCPPCRAEMPQMEKFHAEYGEDIAVLAVNLTDTEKNPQHVAGFVSEYALTFPVILDEQGEVADLFKIFAYPTTYVLDRDGVIRSIHQGAIDYRTMKEATSFTP